MPTAAEARLGTTAKVRRPSRSAEPRLSSPALAKLTASQQRSPDVDTPDAQVPLYMVSEDAARRKYLAFAKSREQHSARRRIEEATQLKELSPQREQNPIASPEARTQPQLVTSSQERRFGSRRSDASRSPAARAPQDLERFELTELVLQLQTALSAARKENLDLRRGKAESIPLEVAKRSVRVSGVVRTTTGCQTVLTTKHMSAADFSGANSLIDDSCMDAVDQALELRRSKMLEKILVERSFKLTEMEEAVKVAEDEARCLRASSEDRDTEVTSLRAEYNAMRARMAILEDVATEAQRRREAAEGEARQAGVLRLEVAKLQATLASKETEVVEVHRLCDYLHSRVNQLERQISMADIVSHEGERRSRIAADCDLLRGRLMQSFYATRPTARIDDLDI